MSDRTPVRYLDPESGTDGMVPAILAGKFVLKNVGFPGFTTTPEEHGAAGDATTDDTAAIISAIGACVLAGGGTVLFDAKTYLCNGALITTSHGYAVIPLPTGRTPIRLRGVAPVNNCSVTTDTGYTIIKTTKTGLTRSGAYGVPSLLGGPTDGTWAETMVSIENIVFWLPHNPTLSAVDLRYVRRVLVDSISTIAINAGDTDYVQPTNVYAFGLRTPEISNYNAVLIRNGMSHGFYVGLVGTVESLTLEYWVSKWCVIGWAPWTGGHAAAIAKLSTEYCNYHISGWSETAGATSIQEVNSALFAAVTIDVWAIEDAPGSPWYTTTAHINDSTNQLYGVAFYDRLGTGGPVATLTVTGGANISLKPLNLAGGVLPAGVAASRAINTDSTLTGGGDLSADRTLGVDTTAEAERIRDVIGAALVGGTNVTITVNDAGDTITIAASATGGAGELLMQDGVTAPPIPIENEARDDWLYQG